MAKVSVIIPTYNRRDTIARAIDSALDQRFVNVEVIVVDDASTDDTVSVLESYDDRIDYIHHDINQGGSAARNTGIERATGDYIAFLDSDDEWHPEKLKRQVEELESRSSDWGAIYCDVNRKRSTVLKQLMDEVSPENSGLEGGTEMIEQVLCLNLAVHAGSTLLVERNVVERINGFDSDFPRHQDIEFLVRLLDETKLAYLDLELVTLHDTGYPSVDNSRSAKQKLRNKYDSDMDRLGIDKSKVESAHNFNLAKAYFREGLFKKGVDHLRQASLPSFRGIAGLAWSIYLGFKQSFSLLCKGLSDSSQQ